MTEDFKDKLLKYFTGNFQEGTTPYTNYQSNLSQNINNLYQTLSSEIGNQYTGGFTITGVFQAKTKNNNLNINILYGTATGSTKYPHNFGFIVLIDSDFNVLDILTKYSSGVIIGDLNVLNVDENGYLYGIETKYNDSQRRFIMLNNVALKLSNGNYEVKIRRTYNFPNSISVDSLFNLIKKEPDGNKYLFAGVSLSGVVYEPIAVELEIIVGASNNWTIYNYSSSYTITGVSTLDLWVTWTNDILDFQILGINYGNQINDICIFYKDNTTINTKKYNYTINDYMYNIGGKMYQKDTAFLGIIRSDYSTYINHYIGVIKPNDLNISIIYSENGGYYGTTGASLSEITINELNIYYTEMIRTSAGEYNCEVGRILIKNGYNIKKIFETTATSNSNYYFNKLFVSQENNLYNWYLQVQDTVYFLKEIFNLNDYEKGNIDNKKYFISRYSNLYSNNELIYSKDLYNITVNDNVTTSTVEIPNMSLNSTTINGENLIGSTYENLVEAGVEFNKNQYETVDVNFINTLEIQNKNNETIQEVEGQNRLNDSISQTTDYEDARMTKYRINYADETNEVNSNIWYPIANYFTTNLKITVSKEISNIEFISEDEQTTYTTIYPVLEIGKTYKISQDVYIAPKGTPEQIYYNTDEVYYGSDEIYY